MPIAAVILAGGEGRRLGGIDKPSLSVAGRSLLQVAIDAVAPYADAVASGAVDIDARSIDAGPYPGPVEARRIALSVDGGPEGTHVDAAAGWPVLVVGPPRPLPPGVLQVREHPAGGGPAAAVAAGVRALPDFPPAGVIAVLAADLPGISGSTIGRLMAALPERVGNGGPAGAVLLDPGGRRQYLIGVWRCRELMAAVGRRPDWTGRPLRELLAPIAVVEIAGSDRETADVDTPDDWRRWQS